MTYVAPKLRPMMIDAMSAECDALRAELDTERMRKQEHDAYTDILKQRLDVQQKSIRERDEIIRDLLAELRALGAAPEDKQYNERRIAWELERTAMGDGYYGNALRVAKDIPCVTPEDRAVLDRYATGTQTGIDHLALQDIALRTRRTNMTIDALIAKRDALKEEIEAMQKQGPVGETMKEPRDLTTMHLIDLHKALRQQASDLNKTIAKVRQEIKRRQRKNDAVLQGQNVLLGRQTLHRVRLRAALDQARS
jgi:hypothetical protein